MEMETEMEMEMETQIEMAMGMEILPVAAAAVAQCNLRSHAAHYSATVCRALQTKVPRASALDPCAPLAAVPGRPQLDDRAVQAEVPGRLLLDPRASPAAVPVRPLLAHRALQTESRGVHRSTNVQCQLRSAVPGRRSACIARCGPRAPLLGNRAMQAAVPGRLLLRASIRAPCPLRFPGAHCSSKVRCNLRSQGACRSLRVHRRLWSRGAHCSTNVRWKVSDRAPTARQTCAAN